MEYFLGVVMWQPFWSLMSISRRSLSYLKLHLRKPEESLLRDLWLTTSFDFFSPGEQLEASETIFFFFVLANFYLHNIQYFCEWTSYSIYWLFLISLHIPSSLQMFFWHLVKCILSVPNYVVVLYFQTGDIFSNKKNKMCGFIYLYI